MAQRISFSLAQPVTIIGWYLSSFLLIADISSIIHIVKVPGERRALTQAFYYAIFAATLYFIIASLMVFTVYGALKRHYPKEFKLTMSQRTLMLQTIVFMVYMVGGAGVWAKIEGWMFLDGLYFTNYTLLTVGIGDYAPQTDLGRGLLFPYAIGGIVILGLVIGSIRSLVLERGKNKLSSRMTEKKREALLKKLEKTGQSHKLTPLESKEQVEWAGMSEKQRRRQEFELMRKIQQQTASRQKWNALFISGSVWFFLWFMGALIFHYTEHEQGWSYLSSLYFAYTTLLTIGYGDFKPYSNSGKAFFVFWSFLAVPTLTILVGSLGDTVVKGIRDATLYLGEFTLLPGEASTGDRVKQALSKVTGGKTGLKITGKITEQPPGMGGGGRAEDGEQHGAEELAAATDRMAGKIEDEELAERDEARRKGDALGENIHEYHYLIVKEFRNVMKHINESPPRKYTYDEWAWLLKLMGEDEGSTTSHRKPPIKVQRQDWNTKPDMQQAQTDDSDKETMQWSWLGNRSPLMGETEEAEWVLERLSVTLEKALKDHSEAMSQESRAKKQAERIPSNAERDGGRQVERYT